MVLVVVGGWEVIAMVHVGFNWVNVIVIVMQGRWVGRYIYGIVQTQLPRLLFVGGGGGYNIWASWNGKVVQGRGRKCYDSFAILFFVCSPFGKAFVS